jgi:hypothetical protein
MLFEWAVLLHGQLVAADSTRLSCEQAFVLDMYARDIVQALGRLRPPCQHPIRTR